MLDDSEGALGLGAPEISILRRLDRNGEGEYRLAGARCRLVDVVELLSDTGLGKEMHSVISQGRVESIVTSKPRDRRLLIEEAAGLGKHRKRRRRAQLSSPAPRTTSTARSTSSARPARGCARSSARPRRPSCTPAWSARRSRSAGSSSAMTAPAPRPRQRRARPRRPRSASAAPGSRPSWRPSPRVARRPRRRWRRAARSARSSRAAPTRRAAPPSGSATAPSRHARRRRPARGPASRAPRGCSRALARRRPPPTCPTPRPRRADRGAGARAGGAGPRSRGRAGPPARGAGGASSRGRARPPSTPAPWWPSAQAARERPTPTAEQAARRGARSRARGRGGPPRGRARIGGELAAVNQFLRHQAGAPSGAPALADDLDVDAGYELALAAALDGRLRAAVVDDRDARRHALLDRPGRDGGRALVLAGGADAAAARAGAPPGGEPLIDHVRGPGRRAGAGPHAAAPTPGSSRTSTAVPADCRASR